MYITVSDSLRFAYSDNPEYLQSMIDYIDVGLRTLHLSLLGRNINAVGMKMHIHLMAGENYK